MIDKQVARRYRGSNVLARKIAAAREQTYRLNGPLLPIAAARLDIVRPIPEATGQQLQLFAVLCKLNHPNTIAADINANRTWTRLRESEHTTSHKKPYQTGPANRLP